MLIAESLPVDAASVAEGHRGYVRRAWYARPSSTELPGRLPGGRPRSGRWRELSVSRPTWVKGTDLPRPSLTRSPGVRLGRHMESEDLAWRAG